MRVLVGVVVWAVALQTVAWLVSVQLTWRVLVVIASASLISTVIDIVVERKK